MSKLHLSPLPSPRNVEESESLQFEREGFVDEQVVAEMVCGPRSMRSMPCPEDLILSVDDMDFAGWQLSPLGNSRSAEVPPQVIDAIVRRATPPAIEEPGIGAPHLGSHRWWLAGLAGVLSTMLFSVLLLTLAHRPGMVVAPHSLSQSKSVPVTTPEAPRSAPELTATSPQQP